METFGSIIMLIIITLAFMMIIDAITKILGGGIGPKLEKYIEEYRNRNNQNK